MRKTIHLIPSDDAGWVLPLFEPETERWSRRRLGQLGMSSRTQDRALLLIAQMLEREGPLTRTDVAERLGAAGVELNSQTRLHILLVAVTSGLACLGPDRGASACLVLRKDWLGRMPRFDREKALAELARRYMRAFAPADERDFAYWSGLPLRDVRSGLAAIAGELNERQVGNAKLLVPKGSRPRPPAAPQVRLLGAFDTYMLGYRSRAFAVPRGGEAVVKEGGGGWIRPVIVEDGRVIGGWQMSRKGQELAITLKPFGQLDSRRRAAIQQEVADIGRFEGRGVALVDP